MFYNSLTLNRHMEVHEQANHKCSECGCGFKTKKRLTIHVKTFHPRKAVTIPCDICNKTFSSKFVFIKHAKKVHGCREEEIKCQSIPCEICKKTFVDKYALQHHTKKFHECREEDKKIHSKKAVTIPIRKPPQTQVNPTPIRKPLQTKMNQYFSTVS